MRLRWPEANSLQLKLLAWLLGSLALLLAITSFWAYREALSAANTAYDRSLLAVARVIGERVDMKDRQVVVEVPYVALDFFESDLRGRVYYRVGGIDGTFVSGFSDLPAMPDGLPLSPDYLSLARFYETTYRGEQVRVVALLQPVFDEYSRGMALVQVAESLTSREHITQRLLQGTVFRELLLIALAGFVIVVVVRATLRPMQQLSAELGSRSASDLSALPVAGVPSEVRPIVEGMNGYMRRLREMIQRQERFIADASHQLRTSLTLLKTQSELALREEDPRRQRESVSAFNHAVSDTVILANQLLEHARVHHAIANHDFHTVDLAGIARQACLDLAPNAVAKSLELGFEGQHATPVHGDAVLLKEVVRNLLDNAIRYTPSGGSVSVQASRGDGDVVLTVEDSGAGIDELDRERVFDPFFRAASREPGVGLGLTIARDIAHAHKGTIELGKAASGTGLRVRVRIPAAP